MAELPVDEPDPLRRLARVRETMERLKSSRQALGAEVLAAVSEWTSATLLSLAVRGASRQRPYNLVVSNVPGPQIPLYMLGARMDRCYPVVNLQPQQGVGVGLFSYAGGLGIGLTADPDQLPDLYVFADLLIKSFEELERLRGPRAARPAVSGCKRRGRGAVDPRRHGPRRCLLPAQLRELPKRLLGTYFYSPSQEVYETQVTARLDMWREAQRNALGITRVENLPAMSEEEIQDMKRKIR